jgi:hypothetical protein
MNNETEEVKDGKFELEVAPIESITRAEIDVQISTAHQFPRSLQQFYKRAEAMVTLDEDTAASCLFKITRGGKAIEGESIRMAEIVASCYGNLRSAVQISGYTPTRVSVRAVCHDLETNNFIAVEKQAKTTYSDGRPYNEDMAIMIANATISKALRDAIFRVVPKALLKPLIEKAKLVAIGTAETLKIRRTKAMSWVTSLKIDKARVFAVLGVVGEEDVGLEQLETLTGLRTAIKEGDQTVDEAFPLLEPTKPLFEHPAKKEQEQPEQKVNPKKEAKTKPAPAPAAVVPETKPSEPEPAQTNVTGHAEPPTTQVSAITIAPEPEPEPATLPPELQTEPATEPVQETKPEPPQPVITDAQAKLRDVILEMGYTFDDFKNWGKSTPMPWFKATPPNRWEDVPDDKASFFTSNKKGIGAAIKTFKAK